MVFFFSNSALQMQIPSSDSFSCMKDDSVSVKGGKNQALLCFAYQKRLADLSGPIDEQYLVWLFTKESFYVFCKFSFQHIGGFCVQMYVFFFSYTYK